MTAAQTNDDEFIVVPILANFDSNTQIGELRVKTAALPPAPNFVFSLGFQPLDSAGFHGNPNGPYVGPYRLCTVALILDDNYIGYLRQIGQLPGAQIQ